LAIVPVVHEVLAVQLVPVVVNELPQSIVFAVDVK
jgi:hypothetical protein